MSLLSIPIYRTEDGTQQNPAIPGIVSTSCDGGALGIIQKKFVEVLLSWDGSAWAEDASYVPGSSIVALKVVNECDDTFAYVNYGFNDFRLRQLCCSNDSEPEGIFAPAFSDQFV